MTDAFKVRCEPVAIEDVERGGGYNGNNQWAHEGRPKPADYEAVMTKCETGRWIGLFRDSVVIDIAATDVAWMKEAQRIGRMTREFSRLHVEERDEMACRWGDNFPVGSWFIRTERVSLKNGRHGTGPYGRMQQVIESLTSSNPGHECFRQDHEGPLRLYLVPFLRMQGDHEFRVFVHETKITAVSCQRCYQDNPWVERMTDAERHDLIVSLARFHEEEVAGPLASVSLTTYTYDVVHMGDPWGWYFIEPNPFGADYAAGSSLFRWTADATLLAPPPGVPRTVHFRYTTRRDIL